DEQPEQGERRDHEDDRRRTHGERGAKSAAVGDDGEEHAEDGGTQHAEGDDRNMAERGLQQVLPPLDDESDELGHRNPGSRTAPRPGVRGTGKQPSASMRNGSASMKSRRSGVHAGGSYGYSR